MSHQGYPCIGKFWRNGSLYCHSDIWRTRRMLQMDLPTRHSEEKESLQNPKVLWPSSFVAVLPHVIQAAILYWARQLGRHMASRMIQKRKLFRIDHRRTVQSKVWKCNEWSSGVNWEHSCHYRYICFLCVVQHLNLGK